MELLIDFERELYLQKTTDSMLTCSPETGSGWYHVSGVHHASSAAPSSARQFILGL